MTKRELIEEITGLNPTAKPAFLAEFAEADLAEYLQHLCWARQRCRQRQAGGTLGVTAAVASRGEEGMPDTSQSGRKRPSAQPAQTPQPVAVAAEEEPSALPFAEDSSREELQAWLY